MYAGPLYAQLTQRLRNRIRAGDWSPGMLLPSEADLAREYGVSVGTARKALEGLETGGWITRRQGRGTFVADLANQQNKRLSRLRSLAGGKDCFAGAIASILDQRLGPATEEHRNSLDLGEDTQVVQITRLYRRDENFRVLEELTAPSGVFPGLEAAQRLPLNLFSLMIDQFSVVPQRSRDRVQAIATPRALASHLDIAEGAPVLFVQSEIWDIDGRRIALISRWVKLVEAAYEVELS